MKPKLGTGKRAPILMTFYLTDDFRLPFGSHCSDFVSYITKSLIINSLYELLIRGNVSFFFVFLLTTAF